MHSWSNFKLFADLYLSDEDFHSVDQPLVFKINKFTHEFKNVNQWSFYDGTHKP